MSTPVPSAAPAAQAAPQTPTGEVNYSPVADVGEEMSSDTSEGQEASDGVEGSEADVIDAAVESGDITKKEAQSLKKKLKIKVDGIETEEEVDFNDEEGLKKTYQKAKAFDKRAKEYASLKNTVDSLLEEFERDPESAMRKIGKDPEKLAEEIIKRKIAEMEKSPEQLEREKMQKELEELRTEKKRSEEERQNLELEKMRNQYATEIENDITSAISGSSLPKGNPRVVKRIAQTMYQVMEMKDNQGNPLYPDVKVQDVLPIVEKEWKEELRSYFDSSAEDMIEELVGKHNLEKLRKKRLASRPAAPKASASSIKDTGTKASVKEEKSKKSYKDFFRD